MFGILIVDGEFFFGVIATPIKILFKTWYVLEVILKYVNFIQIS